MSLSFIRKTFEFIKTKQQPDIILFSGPNLFLSFVTNLSVLSLSMIILIRYRWSSYSQ